jgi:integrase
MLVDLAELTPRDLVCPPGKRRIELVDKNGLGTYLEVRASSPGVATAYIRYKDKNGKSAHQRIGSTTVLGIPEIRREARRIKAEITLGADPRAEKLARKQVMTLDQFWIQDYLPRAMQSKRSWKRDVQLYRIRIQPVFGQHRLTEISRQQIEQFQTKLAEEGLAHASCDLHAKLLRTLMGRAETYGLIKESPARRLRLHNPDNRVQHYLTDEQLMTLLAVLRSDNNRPVCQIIMFMLSTAVRLGEALGARWEDIDRERRIFMVKGAVAKGKRTRSVPLSDAAIEVINSLDTEKDHEFLFVNKRTLKPYTTVTRAWHRIRRRAGLDFLRCHDMRHNMAALMANSGRTLLEIQYVLGHRDPRMALRYIALTNKTMFEAANSTSAALMRNRNSSN